MYAIVSRGAVRIRSRWEAAGALFRGGALKKGYDPFFAGRAGDVRHADDDDE